MDQVKARIQELETMINAAEEDIPEENGLLSEANEISVCVAEKKLFIRKG